MKYKIGDKVRVKSLEWYNENKRGPFGDVWNVSRIFTQEMSKYCGKILTIESVSEDFKDYQVKETDKYFWTDDMFEDDDLESQRAVAKIVNECSYDVNYDLEFQRAITKAVDECLWGTDDEIGVYKETDPTEKLVDNSVEFGKNVMRKKISEYLLKYLPMTPDDKEAFVEEMNKNIK